MEDVGKSAHSPVLSNVPISNLIFNALQLGRLLPVIRHMSADHPRVLMFHRVLPGASRSLGIPTDIFHRQLEELKRNFNVQPLDLLLKQYREGTLAPHSVAITFDDGYSDFAEFVWPALKEHNLPATIFVATGFVDGDCWMWPDILKFALKRTEKSYWRSHTGQHYALPSQAMAAWHAAADHCLLLDESDKWQYIRDFCQGLSVTIDQPPPDPYKALTWDQLRGMDPALISVGSHTVTHPILSRVDAAQLSRELINSKHRIEEQLGRKVTGFCYPNGMDRDINAAVTEAVKRAGYEYACLAYPGRSPLEDPLAINRYPVGYNMSAFKKIIHGYRYLGMKK